MKRRLVVAALFVSMVVPVSATDQAAAGDASLSRTMLRAMRDAQFTRMIDYGAIDEACPDAANPACIVPAPPISAIPNVDLAVITFEDDGKVKQVANVIQSRDQPTGKIVSVDEKTLAATDVQFRAWDIARWNGVTPWTQLPLPQALNTPRVRNATNFASPYPASLFKIMVAWQVMKLIDTGALTLDTAVTDANGTTRAVREWMDAMITVSDNGATRALLYKLHQMNQVDAMNAGFAELGLTTLQINGTNPAAGDRWNPGSIDMGALDTAKLFLLIQGGKGTLWRTPTGRKITRAELSETSRAYLKGLLLDQGFHEVLSTGNMCGASYTTPGIPAVVPSRFIDPTDGTVTVDGIPYFRDVRPCNATAEVTFAHKTGLTWNYGSDGGIVESLPGQAKRTYIIVMLSNLGYRYNDPEWASATVNPCFDPGVCYSKQVAVIGRTIDTALKSAS